MDSFNGPCLSEIKGPLDYAHMIERALVTEVAADDMYSEILETCQDQRILEQIREIVKDEQNHMGRLLYLLSILKGDKFDKNLSAGLQGRDAE